MGYRLTKIYTRQGDDGNTAWGQQRLPKHDVLITAMGTLDELNSTLGIVITLQNNKTMTEILQRIQHTLFDVGGELHSPHYVGVTAEKVQALEQQIDAWNADLPPLQEFILPGGNPAAAFCHLARTVCRRAERDVVQLHHLRPVQNLSILHYINRLSDFLFVAARILARETVATEVMWDHERRKF